MTGDLCSVLTGSVVKTRRSDEFYIFPRPVSLNTASVRIFEPIGMVTSSFGAGIPAPILLFLRDNPSSVPPDTDRSTAANVIRRIPMWKTAFRPVLCVVTKMNERPLRISCPAHLSRRASAPARNLKINQYVSNSGSNMFTSLRLASHLLKFDYSQIGSIPES